MKSLVLLIALAFLVPLHAEASAAKAEIKPTKEGTKIEGEALFSETDKGLEIKIQVAGVPAGSHGIHVHENGSCADGGNAAGSHYNPTGAKHGLITQEGPDAAHIGDFGNIEVGQDGTGSVIAVVPDLSVSGGKYNVKDRAIVLHEKADDFGQPTGNAGGRIGCGVIKES